MTEDPAAAAEDLPALQAPERAKPDGPWDDPRLPWSGKPRRVDILCWAAITLTGLYYLLLLPFRASLVGTHPLLLVALNGSTEGIVSAAAFARVGQGSIPVVVLVAVFGVMKFDLIYWWAGRLWGERIILLLSGRRKHGPKFIARVHRWGRKFTWPIVLMAPFLPLPNPIIYAVLDPSDVAPVLKTPSGAEEAGRGLQMVDALSDVWGWSPVTGRGKAVWAILFCA